MRVDAGRMLDGQARHVNRYSPIKRILCTNFSKSTGLTMYELQRCLYRRVSPAPRRRWSGSPPANEPTQGLSCVLCVFCGLLCVVCFFCGVLLLVLFLL